MSRASNPMRKFGLMLAALALPGCAPEAEPPLREITKQAGLTFTHTVDPEGSFPLPEIMGAGCAVFDANGDGHLDLYFTDAGHFDGPHAPNRLYLRNADGKYRDATEESGLGDKGYGMGVAVGDIDNDGDLDVYVGNYGPDAIYRNDGKGKFTNITAAAGITNPAWTSSVAFLDYDADGYLDVFVVNYVKYDKRTRCDNPKSGRDYCGPQMFQGVADMLYRNNGNGTFSDVSEQTGIGSEASNGLGLVVEDFNDDGYPDVFVANDAEANHLWINDKKGKFTEEALSMGVAVNEFSITEASMGVACGDVDNDGDPDLFMTHLINETNTLYLRTEFGFDDGSRSSGIDAPSLPFTGFGTVLFDLENDGDLDLAIANGRVLRGDRYPGANGDELFGTYAEPNQLFLGNGAGKFTDISATDPAFCGTVEISRALAVDDLDGDGDLDVVVANCKGPARIYENVAAKSGRWVIVRAVDPKLQRDAYGAVVRLHAGGKVYRRSISPGNSYLSSSMIPAHFGLGKAAAFDRIEVVWPGGAKEMFPGGATNRRVTVTRGTGK